MERGIKIILRQQVKKGIFPDLKTEPFKPEESVTREQFVAMMLRYTKTSPTRGETFSDVSINRWSAGYIYTAVELGIISGYQDGTFKPENPVTRAEAARIVNVATGRNPNKEVIDNMVCPYSDLPKSHWAYYELMYGVNIRLRKLIGKSTGFIICTLLLYCKVAIKVILWCEF